MANHLFKTYTIYIITPGKHMLKTVSETAMEKMCVHLPSKYEFTKLEMFNALL